MSRYERLYKCRLCDKIFSVDCTDSIKTATNCPLGRILAANCIAPTRMSDITAAYIMHKCDYEISGVADFVGVRKVDDDRA